ncbi:MAG: membrane protein insertion efficiency factor YidD [Chthoniobacter sp.]|nr:membrane protein insertion efficiency factor YidD [Chthoniobacter sp.]
MPTLPACLSRPHAWLAGFGLLIALELLDICRSPNRQVTPRIYTGAVSVYQWTKPRLGIDGCCRFSPSCSHYSQSAVRKYGMLKGLKLTFERIDRCRTNIPSGTKDPVK